MKKTFRFLSMATLLVVGAIMTGCSSDENIDNPQQPANNDNVVTLTATVSLNGGAETRAITPNGTNPWPKTFEAGNQIAVIYKSGTETKKAESTTFTPSADGKNATFTVTLTSPANNSAIRYIYPASMAKAVATSATITDDDATIDYTGLMNNQNGDLTTLGTYYDLAVFDGSLSGTDLPASATLTNPLAICKFTMLDGTTDITPSVTSLTISDGTNSYAVTPSTPTTTPVYIYVAMKPVTSGNIAFAAATSTTTYFKTATNKTLAASKIYPIDVSLIGLAKGNVICSDGSLYASKATAEGAGKTPVAVVAYLGSSTGDATYKHGLALALADATTSEELDWCNQTTSALCLGTGKQKNNETAAKGDLAGIANTDALFGHGSHTHAAAEAAKSYNSGAHPAGTSAWFLPSAGQWNQMFIANGGSGASCSGLNTTITDAGGTALGETYWSSTERDGENAWRWLQASGAVTWYYQNKENSTGFPVRACIAF